MLSPNDVISLEERWEKWNRKKYIKPIFITVLIICIPVISFYMYTLSPKTSIEQPTQALTPPQSNTSTLSEANKTKPILANNSTIDTNESTDKPIDMSSEKPRLALTIQPIPRSSQNKTPPLPKSETINLEKNSPTPQSPKENVSDNKDSTFVSSVIDTPQEIKESKEDSKIKIEMQPSNADSTQYLKEKFDTTGNIVFALMVSEEYYHMENYNDSIRWALTANEIDPKNERSWILFAQSKAKLGYQKEAIMALEEFLKLNNSGKIESLLIKLKRGMF